MDLTIELGSEIHANAELTRTTESTEVYQHPKRVSLEAPQEALGEASSNTTFLLVDICSLSKSHLHHSSINFSIPSKTSFFKALRLHELGFLNLPELSFVLTQNGTFITLNDLYTSLLNRFAD